MDAAGRAAYHPPSTYATRQTNLERPASTPNGSPPNGKGSSAASDASAELRHTTRRRSNSYIGTIGKYPGTEEAGKASLPHTVNYAGI